MTIFLLISIFPSYHAPFIFPYFICILCILKETLHLKLSQTAHIHWIHPPACFHSSRLLEKDAVFPSGECMEKRKTGNTQDRLSGVLVDRNVREVIDEHPS